MYWVAVPDLCNRNGLHAFYRTEAVEVRAVAMWGLARQSAVALGIVLYTLLIATPINAGEHRSSTVRRRFLASLGLKRTPPGCQVDHWQPLSRGGKDDLSNLRLICGDYMREKEKRELNTERLLLWLKENPCELNLCINPKE